MIFFHASHIFFTLYLIKITILFLNTIWKPSGYNLPCPWYRVISSLKVANLNIFSFCYLIGLTSRKSLR